MPRSVMYILPAAVLLTATLSPLDDPGPFPCRYDDSPPSLLAFLSLSYLVLKRPPQGHGSALQGQCQYESAA